MPLTPAREKQLVQMLGRPLPADYARLLRAFPQALAKQLAHRGPDAEQPLFRDARTVVAENRRAREEDIWTEEGPWPKGHLMIGAESGGDKFTLRASAKPAVYRLLHESATLERVGPFAAYLRAVKRWLAGDAKTIGEALSPAPKKEQPWQAERRKMAARAPAQERRAKKTEDPNDWGDATLFYEAGGRWEDALRCCERWIELSGRERFPRSIRARLVKAKRSGKS
jgi:hypothetical protein